MIYYTYHMCMLHILFVKSPVKAGFDFEFAHYIFVTGFAKRGLPHTSNLPTLTINNFGLKTAIPLKFEQQ